MLEKVQAEDTYRKLAIAERGFRSRQSRLERTVVWAERAVTEYEAKLPALRAALERRVLLQGDTFAMTVNGQRCSNRADAALALGGALRAAKAHASGMSPAPVPLGELGGLDWQIKISRYAGRTQTFVAVPGVPGLSLEVEDAVLSENSKVFGLLARMTNAVRNIDGELAQVQRDIAKAIHEKEQALAQVGESFPQAEALTQAKARLDVARAAIAAAASTQQRAAQPDAPTEKPPPAPAGAAVVVAGVASDPERAQAIAKATAEKLRAAGYPVDPAAPPGAPEVPGVPPAGPSGGLGGVQR
jgi:hypothetical protein